MVPNGLQNIPSIYAIVCQCSWIKNLWYGGKKLGRNLHKSKFMMLMTNIIFWLFSTVEERKKIPWKHW